MAKKQELNWMWIIGIVVAFIIILPYLNLNQKFAISDNDWTLVDDVSANQAGYTINNGTINFGFYGNNYSLNSGDSLYFLGNASECSLAPTQIIYQSVPYLEGTNRLCRVQYYLASNETEVRVKTYFAIYTKEVQTNTEYVNISIPGPTIFINQTINKTIYINQTVTKEIQIEPTLFEKYGISAIIFVVLTLIIIYLIYRRKTK